MENFAPKLQQPFVYIVGSADLRQDIDAFILKDNLIIPFYISLILGAFYLIDASLRWLKQARNHNPCIPEAEEGDRASQDATLVQTIRVQAKEQGGWSIFLYSFARLIGCIVLFALSVTNLYHSFSEREISTPLVRQFLQCPESYMALTYLYCSALAFVSLSNNTWSPMAKRNNMIILFTAFCVYAYRDLWPYATYMEVPRDISEGSILWAKVVTLFITAVVIPLFEPTYYVPVDTKNPMPMRNPEQTCCMISFLTFTFLDPIVLASYRVEHLTLDQLPPLSDRDASKNLIRRAFSAKPRHLFFGLMRVFWKEYALMAASLVIQALAGFLAPIAIFHVLGYLETGGVGDTIRPWFWLLFLFIGPLLNGLCFQLYLYYGSIALTYAEALLTELVFEHSLRIRFTTEESSEKSSPSQSESAESTLDSASVTEHAENEPTADSTTEGSSRSINAQSETTQASKGKDEEDTASGPAAAHKTTPPSGQAPKKNSNLLGKINNLVTTDLATIGFAKDFLMLIISVPLQIILCCIFLYQILGWSSFVGLAAMLVLLPAPGYAANLTQKLQEEKMNRTDARVQAVTEVVNVLRMVKLFGWEEKMSKKIKETREEELNSIWWLKIVECCIGIVNSIIPTVHMLVTYVTYTVVMKQELTPSIIFSSLAVFDKLRGQLWMVTYQITSTTRGKVSLDRINDFLKKTELIDAYAKVEPEQVVLDRPPSFDEKAIGFKNAIFCWSLGAADGSLTPSRRSYKLRVEDELLFQPNYINLIVGPTGSGKTSILMALLGEMHFIRNGTDSWFNLPREGGVAYAAQESWVQNETIQSNILFGSPYDETRYRKVLDQCALDKDLELFEAGDNTEVGEKGITLSGGQKARLTLARAIYSPAQILLLDDVLAALDVHTAINIVEKCFKGDLVRGRTIILATHNVALSLPIAKFVVTIGQDGKITNQSNDIPSLLASNPIVAEEYRTNAEELEVADQVPAELQAEKKPSPNGKLVLAEEVAKGHVTWKSLKLFLSGLGGNHPILFFGVWFGSLLMSDGFYAFQHWFLGYWGSQYEKRPPSEVSVSYYCMLYAGIALFSILIADMTYFLYVSGTMRASRAINTKLVESVLGCTLRWLDETPTARIITRFTQDIQQVDGTLANSFQGLVSFSVSLVVPLGIIMIFAPVSIAPGLIVATLGLWLGNVFLKAQLSVMREKSNARAPVLAHFSAAIAGIVSIRAYGSQLSFKSESLKRIDKYIHVSRVTSNLNRWIGIRIDFLGGMFSVALASYLIYGEPIGSSNTGFLLNMASEFCFLTLHLVRVFNEFQVQSNSLERIQGYLDINHEPISTESGKPPAAWPTSSNLVVKNLSARYSQDGPKVLHDLSFHVASGQRIGVVGRTGSGKSSLTLALLRCIVTEGSVYYDGIDTKNINLDALRFNITIIPQTPELISGALRRNLDPFDQYDDATLNDALQSAGLFSLQDELGEARITLDSEISTGGSNLSTGEKQILALARAMVRRSKLLILDEATSAIDCKTDSIIQTTLRHKLDPDVTVITVAHRLQTIMDADKIMVLSEGRLAEFDTPETLLSNTNSLFKALVDGSGDRDALYEMVASKHPGH